MRFHGHVAPYMTGVLVKRLLWDGDFQGMEVYRPMSFGVSAQRERICSRAARDIGSMSPPGYPSAWLHPCSARFRFT